MTKKTRKVYWKLVGKLGRRLKNLDEDDCLKLERLFEETFENAYRAGADDEKNKVGEYEDPGALPIIH